MFGYRKLIFCAVSFLAASVFLVLQFISGSEWVATVSILAGVFTAGNVAGKFAGKGGPE